MRSSILWVVALLLCSSPLQADDAARVLSAGLKALVSRDAPAAEKRAAAYIRIVVKGEAATLREAIESNGGRVGTHIGDIATARLPLAALSRLAQRADIKRIERPLRLRPANDTAARRVGAEAVHAGRAPLERAYTGAGVVVGVIDSGIDFRHADFRDPDDPSKSRILAIWDQTDDSGEPPPGFDYGSEWTREHIEAALRDELDLPHVDEDGHGTHVAGTAAGNGAATGRFRGMAPEADIIMVKGDVTGGEEPEELRREDVFAVDVSLADGANYIYRTAGDLGQPAVINASVGGQATRHDGTSLEEVLLDRLIGAAPGRAFAASAANQGASAPHWGGFELAGEDSLWTLYAPFPFGAEELDDDELLELGARFGSELLLFGSLTDADLDDTQIAVGLDSLDIFDLFTFRPGDHEAKTEWIDLRQLAAAEQGIEEMVFYGDGTLAGVVQFFGQITEDGGYEFFMRIGDTMAEVDDEEFIYEGWDLWRVMARGSGTIHVWGLDESSPGLGGFLTSVFGINALVSANNYRPTDNLYTIDAPASARSVIAVGAYANRDSDELPEAEEVFAAGDLAVFSSRGPTADGRIKPDIVAPGQSVASALSADAPAESTGPMPDQAHFFSDGTSMSSPVVAGAIALYLQQNPRATQEEIRAALQENALHDEATASFGPLPNNHWGYGKLDIFRAMSGVPTAVALERRTDSTPATSVLHQNYPNPFNPSTLIRFDLSSSARVSLQVFNPLGQQVAALVEGQRLAPGRYSVRFDGSGLSSNLYFYRLTYGAHQVTRSMMLIK